MLVAGVCAFYYLLFSDENDTFQALNPSCSSFLLFPWEKGGFHA